ncbi:MAG: hypothetical protein D6824_07795 [Planctomycetota bacterium]|nr:MAG: hypothetical protein D6824_07795 [Planctomycetota bacterium]
MSDAHPPSAHRPEIEGPIVAHIEGDRCCPACGFNLVGSPVRREPVYGLYLLRCPECGRACPVDEHPRIERWTSRLTALLAALWLLGLTLATVGVGSLMLVGAGVATQALSGRFGLVVQQAFNESEEGQAFRQGVLRSAGNFDAAWLTEERRAALWREFGGTRRGLWIVGGSLVWLAVWLYPVGALGSVLALARRRWELLLVSLLPAVGAASLLLLIKRFTAGHTTVWSASEVVQRWLLVPWGVVGIVFCWASFALGLVSGRALARGLARALLPPRLCASLSILWTSQGLEPPRRSGALRRAARSS